MVAETDLYPLAPLRAYPDIFSFTVIFGFAPNPRRTIGPRRTMGETTENLGALFGFLRAVWNVVFSLGKHFFCVLLPGLLFGIYLWSQVNRLSGDAVTTGKEVIGDLDRSAVLDTYLGCWKGIWWFYPVVEILPLEMILRCALLRMRGSPLEKRRTTLVHDLPFFQRFI